jgi:hypothetical protein
MFYEDNRQIDSFFQMRSQYKDLFEVTKIEDDEDLDIYLKRFSYEETNENIIAS